LSAYVNSNHDEYLIKRACNFFKTVVSHLVGAGATLAYHIPKAWPCAPDSRAGGGAPAMESRLSTLATCGFGVRTSLEATTG